MLGVAGLVALVPLSVWFATGSLVQAIRAIRGYGGMLFVLGLFIGAGALVGFIAGLIP